MNHDQQYQQHLRLRYMEQTLGPQVIYQLRRREVGCNQDSVLGYHRTLKGARRSLGEHLKLAMHHHEEEVEYLPSKDSPCKWQIWWYHFWIEEITLKE